MIQSIQDFLSSFMQRSVLADLFLIAGIFALTWLASKLIHIIQTTIFCRLVKRTKSDLDDQIFGIVDDTIKRLVWFAGFYFMVMSADAIFPETSHLKMLVKGGLYIAAVLMIAHLVSGILQILISWYNERIGSKTNIQLRDEFQPLIRRLIMIVVYTSAVVMILEHFDQNISSILVSLGIGSLAFALAAKDTLANMIAGFMIMTDRPFRLGDRILLESGEKGDVYDIGLRSTKILTADNTLIVVPNHQIINEKVTNLSYPDPQIRVSVEVGVAYGSDLNAVKSILVQICNEHPDVLEDPPPAAYFLNFGDSSLDFKVVCRVSKWGDQWRVSEEIRSEIYLRFEANQIEIPFPQRVVTLNSPLESS
jgi:small-conductance mechanosensitive channel